jgi:hypothetical protein
MNTFPIGSRALVIVAVFAVCFQLACGTRGGSIQSVEPSPTPLSDTFIIYSDILKTKGSTLVLDRTVKIQPLPPNTNIREMIPSKMASRVTGQMMDDLQSKADEPIRDQIPGNKVVKVITPQEKTEMFKRLDPPWDIKKAYPDAGGIVSLSHVVFTEDRKTALVYVDYWCGSLCGEGSLYLYEKSGEGWNRVSDASLWVS